MTSYSQVRIVLCLAILFSEKHIDKLWVEDGKIMLSLH